MDEHQTVKHADIRSHKPQLKTKPHQQYHFRAIKSAK